MAWSGYYEIRSLDNSTWVRYRVVLASKLARFVRWLRRRPQMGAITIRRSILVADEEISPALLRHEAHHVAQWHHYGTFGFLRRYIAQCVKHGYWDAPFEVEARTKEKG